MIPSQADPSVLVVDDDPAGVAALVRLLRTDRIPALTATGGEEALMLLEEQASSIVMVISDYAMPGLDGITFLRTVRLRWPEIARILLTGHADLPTAVRAINEGQVSHLILKPWEPHELRRLLAETMERQRAEREHHRLRALVEQAASALGQTRSDLAHVRPHSANRSHPAKNTVPRLAGGSRTCASDLTPRELDVLRLLSRGRTNKEIGAELILSPGTVKSYVEQILAKLRAADRTQAAVRALELGLVSA